MHIKELVSLVDIEEARKNNWGREKSTAAGQALGQQYAQGLPTADRDAEIQKIRAQTVPKTNPDLQARLAGFKAGKKAATGQAGAAPQQSVGTSTAQPDQNIGQQTGTGQQATDTNQQGDAGAQQPSGWEKFKQGAKRFGQSVAKNAPGVVQGVGNLAAQTAAGLGQTATAGIGGAIRGYKTARAGLRYGSGGSDVREPSASAPAAASGAAQANDVNAVSDEIASLRDVINRMNRRLSNIEQGTGQGPQQNLRVAEQRKRLRIER